MICAPCLAASCAACSCFWIIDSLSPVQLACRSAPRPTRGISGPRWWGSLPEGRERIPARLSPRPAAPPPPPPADEPVLAHECGRALDPGQVGELVAALDRPRLDEPDPADVRLPLPDVGFERRPLLGHEDLRAGPRAGRSLHRAVERGDR